MGSGYFSKVYKLDDKYVFKIGHHEDISLNNFKLVDNSVFKNLKTWDGAILAETGHIKFLKNANPAGKAIPVGVPSEITDINEIKKIYKEKYLLKCVNLPQKAFDDIALDFKTLNSIPNPDSNGRPFLFDTINPNNFLLSDDSIRIVDDFMLDGKTNNLSSMLNVMLCKYNLDKYVEFDKELVEPRIKILLKCILAAEKAQLPISTVDEDIVEHAFKNAGLDIRWPVFEQTINQLRQSVPDIEQRIKLLEEYFNQL